MPRYLALDWDHGQLHLVAATVRGQTVKVQRALFWQEQESPNPANAVALGQHLKHRLKEAGIAPAPLLACVGRERIILKHLRYPAVPASEEPRLVRFQAVKELSDAPDEVVIDYTPVGERNGEGEYRSLAPVLRKELLATYQALSEAAGLKLAGLTPRPFGIAACLRKVIGTTVLTPLPEPPDAVIAVVTLNERWAEFSILQGEGILMVRALTQGKLPRDGIVELANEIRRNLLVHAGQAPLHPVRALYMAGASSGELREQLVHLIDIPIHPFDPFAGAESLDLPTGNRGSFAGAAGLLQARAQSSGLPINFIEPREPAPERRFPRVAVLVALLLVVLLFAGGVIGATELRKRQKRKLAEAETRSQEIKGELFRVRQQLKKLEPLDEWDNVVWLDEIYDLTQHIPNVNEVRIEELSVDPLPRTDPSGYSAILTIKGKFQGGRGSQRHLDTLVERFRDQKPYYSVETGRPMGDTFIFKVKVKRRPPEEYTTQLNIPKSSEPDRDRGGLGDFVDPLGGIGGGFPNP